MNLGKYNTLKANREQPQGWYLIDSEGEEVLLPGKYAPEGFAEGDEIEVFIYTDSEDRNVATTEKPYVTRGSFACLEVKEVTSHGAFMDWGLEKDLFVPFKEQKDKMEEGLSYVIFLYTDWSTNRLCGSSKLNQFFGEEIEELEVGQEVEVLVFSQTELGYNVVINDRFKGLLYQNEVYQNLFVGDQKTAYIKRIREDGKIDLRLQKDGLEAIDENAQKLLAYIKEFGGETSLTDKSAPEDIQQQVGMSKKAFKKALGSLYKARKVIIMDNGIKLNTES